MGYLTRAIVWNEDLTDVDDGWELDEAPAVTWGGGEPRSVATEDSEVDDGWDLDAPASAPQTAPEKARRGRRRRRPSAEERKAEAKRRNAAKREAKAKRKAEREAERARRAPRKKSRRKKRGAGRGRPAKHEDEAAEANAAEANPAEASATEASAAQRTKARGKSRKKGNVCRERAPKRDRAPEPGAGASRGRWLAVVALLVVAAVAYFVVGIGR